MGLTKDERRRRWDESERARLECRRTDDTSFYEERREALALLGFVNYGEYLRSDLWQCIRVGVLAGHPSCLVCSYPATQVHHQSYGVGVMMGLDPTPLVPLCRKCHRRVEFTCRGNKRTGRQARATCTLLVARLERRRKKWCRVCGNKAKKGSTLCRPCARRAAP